MIGELSNEYVGYVKVDVTKELKYSERLDEVRYFWKHTDYYVYRNGAHHLELGPRSAVIDLSELDLEEFHIHMYSFQLAPVGETIEDMLIRLEEFESLVNMVQTNGCHCLGTIVPEVLARKDELRSLCERIDSLESFVGRVRHDLDIVEAQMDAAEVDVGISEGKFKNILKPLFFKKVDNVVARNVRSPTYEPPEIFKTSHFFPPEDNAQT